MTSIWHPALFPFKNVSSTKWPAHTFRLLLRDQTACAGGKTQSYTFRGGEYRFKKRGGRTYLQITKACFNRDRSFFKRFDTYQNRVDSVLTFFKDDTRKGRRQEAQS